MRRIFCLPNFCQLCKYEMRLSRQSSKEKYIVVLTYKGFFFFFFFFFFFAVLIKPAFVFLPQTRGSCSCHLSAWISCADLVIVAMAFSVVSLLVTFHTCLEPDFLCRCQWTPFFFICLFCVHLQVLIYGLSAFCCSSFEDYVDPSVYVGLVGK